MLRNELGDLRRERDQTALLRASLTEDGDLKAALDEHAIVAITDPRGRITFVNDKFCAISKYAREELLGQDHRLINSGFHSKEFILDLWSTIMDGRVWQGEIKNRAKDGSLYWVATTIVPFLDDEGKPRRYAAIGADTNNGKRAEAALRQNEQELTDFFDNASVGLHWVGPDGIILRANQTELDLLGYSRDEYVGHHIADFHADQNVIKDILLRLSCGETITNYEASLRCKDGTIRHVLISSNVLFRDGQFIHTRCFTRDITDRKRVEEAERQNAALFSSLIEQAPMGVYVVDSQFRLHQVNTEAMPAFEKVQPLLGRDFNEVMEILWGPQLGPQLAEIFRHTLDTGERYISPPFTEQRHDIGEEQAYEWQTQRVTLPDGQHGVVCYFHEVTERARAEQALRASEDRTRLATTATGVGIWEWNILTNTIRWDTEMFRMYSVTPTPSGVVAYNTWSEAVLPDDLPEQEAALQETLRRGGQSRRTFRIRRDGELRHIQSVETVRKNAQGQTEWVVGTNLDVTERKRSEEELHRLAADLSEANRRKDEFLATLAHELRNPLAPIRSGLQIMRVSIDNATAVEKARLMMERQLTQMVRLIDDLMDVSRISRGKLELREERVELAVVLNNAIETCRPIIESSGLELTLSVPGKPIFLYADVTRLAQVFANLLNNAAKFSDPGSRIWLSVDLEGGEVVVSVKDNGVGIAAEMLTKIFEMFTQVHGPLLQSRGGLGIGLSLVKRLVGLHGGSVVAKSQGAGFGSEFVVRLPVELSTVAQTKAPSDTGEATPLSSPRRVLVADDNEDAVTSLGMLLQLMGNEVRTANDGSQAVDIAATFRPDIVLLDIGMPELDGYETCRRIRQQPWGNNALLVALTGWGQEEDKRRSQEAGFDHHLVKPVEPAVLEALLASWTARE